MTKTPPARSAKTSIVLELLSVAYETDRDMAAAARRRIARNLVSVRRMRRVARGFSVSRTFREKLSANADRTVRDNRRVRELAAKHGWNLTAAA